MSLPSSTPFILQATANFVTIYILYPTPQFSSGVEKSEKANGLCNPLMILFRWIFSWLLKVLILKLYYSICSVTRVTMRQLNHQTHTAYITSNVCDGGGGGAWWSGVEGYWKISDCIITELDMA